MFDINPFAELSHSISPAVMQGFVIAMAVCVAGGTLYDVIHKGSAKYFFGLVKGCCQQNSYRAFFRKSLGSCKNDCPRFLHLENSCNFRRRLAHLLTMYGFLAYVIATATMVFAYPTAATPAPAIGECGGLGL